MKFSFAQYNIDNVHYQKLKHNSAFYQSWLIVAFITHEETRELNDILRADKDSIPVRVKQRWLMCTLRQFAKNWHPTPDSVVCQCASNIFGV